MLTRFDHAAIACPDLAGAIELFNTTLGLAAEFGGRHTGRGTENGIVRFGLDYLELMGVYDAAELRPAGEVILDVIARLGGGPLGFALATNDIHGLGARFHRLGLPAVGPVAMARTRPDGRILAWQLLVPGGNAWRTPWPFFIQWDDPDADRLSWERPGRHPLGAIGVAGVSVAIGDLAAGRDLYERQLGLTPVIEETLPELAARRTRCRLGTFTVDLLAPTGAGPVATAIADAGEGLFEIVLRVANLAAARASLGQNGVATTAAPGLPGGYLLPPARTANTRFVLTENPL